MQSGWWVVGRGGATKFEHCSEGGLVVGEGEEGDDELPVI